MSTEKVFPHAEYIGDSFGGRVHQIALDTLQGFYEENWDNMTRSGQRSFLKALGIPPGFFDKRNSVLRKDIVIDTKFEAQNRSNSTTFLALEVGELIGFVAPLNPFLGWESPSSVLGLDDQIWLTQADSLEEGFVRYLHSPWGDPLAGDYLPSAFFTLPIFYHRPFRLDLGVFKLICTNGWIDRLNVKSTSFNHMEFTPELFEKMLKSVNSAVEEMRPEYVDFMDVLAKTPLTPREFMDLVSTQMLKPNSEKTLLPKQMVNIVGQYCNHLAVGNDGGIPKAPSKIENMLDAVDMLTVITQDVDNVKTRDRLNTGIFTWFFNHCVSLGHTQVMNVDLANHFNASLN